jgi:putative ABC transport system permease protein
VRHALRLLTRQPGFSIVVILSLGLGIGAATAVFTLVQSVLLHELPFADPDRLVWMYNARTERDRAPFSIPDLNDYRRDTSTLAGLAPFTNWTANLTGASEAERLEGTRVGGNFFQLLGARAALGRPLTAADEVSGSLVAVLTHGLWTRRFGGHPAVVGTSVILNGASYTVVGVMSPGFLFPFRDAEVAVPLPLRDDPRRTDRGANFLRVVARLKPDTSIAQAKADLDATARRLQQQFPDDDARKTGVNLYPLQAEMVSDYGQILWTLFAAVGVLLAIGCGNLANLMLLRAAGRRPELALRVSLGASRGAIARQLLFEAGTLAVCGGSLGVVIARWAVSAWRAFGPANFPRLTEVAIDSRVLAFAVLAAVAAALVSGLVPAWFATRDLREGMGGETRSTTGNRKQAHVRRLFVVLQVAGATVLLIGMVLVARGLGRLEQVDPGFTRARAVSVQLSLPAVRYSSREAIARFYDALNPRFAAVPGATAVGAVSLLPMSGLLNTMDVAFPDRPAPPADEVPQAHFRMATPGYFAAAGVRIWAGREFDAHDADNGRPVAIVSRTFAERHWSGQQAVGKTLQIGTSGARPVVEVVGVAADVKQFTLDAMPTADLYIPLYQMPASQVGILTARMYWVIRTEADPRSLESDIRRSVRMVDSDVAASSIRTLDDIVSLSLAGKRMNVRLLEVFGQVAIALAGMGVYAIAAFSAATRKRELAIRAAFGASRQELARLLFREELRPVLLGVGIGMLTALGLSRPLEGVLFQISARDPFTYFIVAAALLGVAFAASYVPARRAGLADPVELLHG